VNTYSDADYTRLYNLTKDYREKYIAACKACEDRFVEMDLALILEADDMRSVLAATVESSKVRMRYELCLKLLLLTRRFQGNLCRFGLAGSQTHIAVCDSIYAQFNSAMSARQFALKHNLPVHDLHLEYH
jgi:hypothetical protein